jgi:tRNA dimethylallyltransferase
VRERWERLYDERGGEAAHALLSERDPDAAAAIHSNDRRRVVRALELAEAGRSLRGDNLWTEAWRRPTLVVGLDVPVVELDRRIAARTRAMFENGVVEEVRSALAGPLSATAGKVLGLREVADLPRAQAEMALVLRTRQLAAYQRKWMRRIPGLVTVRADRSPDEVVDDVLALARGRQRVPAGRES